MATVRSLITRFGFEVDSASQSRAEGAVNRLSNMLQGLAAFASLNALAKLGDSTQSLEARIGMLEQTTTSANEAFNQVAKHATDARQSLDAYGTLYTRIANAGKKYLTTQDDVLKITDTISKALVVGGATTQEASSTMIQFAQALGSGTLQGEEFRAMAEAAPQYMDELARVLGHPRENLKKLASEGKITSKDVIEATMKMSATFDDKFSQMPLTIGQATTIISNKFGTMFQNINSESKVITKIATFFVNSFELIETKAKEFVDAIGGADNAVKLFGIALAALLGPFVVGALIAMFGAIFSVAGLITGAIILVGLAIDDLLTYLDGGQSVIGDFLNSTSGQLTMFIAALSAASLILASGPIGWIAAAIAAVGVAIYLLWNNWDKILGWMGEKVKTVIDFVKSLGDALSFGDGKDLNATVTSVNQNQAAGAAGAGGGNTINSNQNINITVPEGTTAEQQAMIKSTAAQAYQQDKFDSYSRDFAMAGF